MAQDAPTSSDDLSEADKRNILTFLAVVAASAAAVGVAAVANSGWTDGDWVAVGAIAAVAQAIGVVFAVIYAARQISESRQQAEWRRRVELAERLADAFYGRMEPSFSAVKVQLRMLSVIMNEWDDLADDSPRVLAAYEYYRGELRTAWDAARASASEVGRILWSMRYPPHQIDDVEFVPHAILPWWPMHPSEVSPPVRDQSTDDLDRVKTWVREVVLEELDKAAPGRRRPGTASNSE